VRVQRRRLFYFQKPGSDPGFWLFSSINTGTPVFSQCGTGREMAAGEDFLQVSCENRGTRIVMPGMHAPAPAIIQGYS